MSKELPKILNFLNDIEALSKKYGLSISHEDTGGAFIIEEYDDEDIEWLRQAHIRISKGE